MSKLKIYFLLLITTVLAYGLSVRYGFSQDDWYFLSISTAENFAAILDFFNPAAQSGFAFYRPLGTQLYFYLARSWFGLAAAPLGMHLFMLFIHSVNALQVYRLVSRLRPKHGQLLPVLTGVLYAASAAHFLSLYYISATQQLLAALFSLLSINAFLDRRGSKAGLYFALALLSKETAVVTPAIAFLLTPLPLRRRLTSLTPYLLTGLLYLLLRFTGGVTVQSEYHLVFDLSVLSTLRWYYLFTFGAPEELVRYGLPRAAIDFAAFVRDFGLTGLVLILGPTLFGVFALVRLLTRRAWVYLCWWLLAVLPVIFLQDHRYPHYLDLALIPFLLLILEGLSRRLQLVLTGSLLFVSLLSLNLSEEVHWTTKRAKISERAVAAIAARSLCRSQSWLVTGQATEPRELSYALSLENGPRVICDHPVSVYYQGVSGGPLPSDPLKLETKGIIWP